MVHDTYQMAKINFINSETADIIRIAYYIHGPEFSSWKTPLKCKETASWVLEIWWYHLAARAPPRKRWGGLQHSHRPLSWWEGVCLSPPRKPHTRSRAKIRQPRLQKFHKSHPAYEATHNCKVYIYLLAYKLKTNYPYTHLETQHSEYNCTLWTDNIQTHMIYKKYTN